MSKNNIDTRSAGFNPGNEVFSWISEDYHPHNRGSLWIIVFSVFMFGVAIWSYLSDPKTGWVTALTLFLALAMYFYMHRNGREKHSITVFQNGIFIDQVFVSFVDLEGFWFIYDQTASIITLEQKGKTRSRIQLQLGEESPETLREVFAGLDLLELTDRQESLVDLWIRALKL